MNDLDARIRAAVTELAEAAPPPKSLPVTATNPDRSYRWLAIAAATVLIVAGVVAIATWQSTRDDTTPLDRVAISTPGVTLAPPPTSGTTTPDTMTPTTTPTTTPTATARTIPAGEITARPGDVLAVDGSGAVVLIGIDGGTVVPRVTLLAAPLDPAAQNIHVAGLVDGTVLYGVTDGTTSAVMALTAPGAAPIELATSADGPWLSPDGEQWATIDPSGGRLVIRRTDGAPGATIDLDSGGSVAWSPNGTSMYLSLSDEPLTWLRRYAVDDGYRMTDEVEGFRQTFDVAGVDGSGNLVVSWFRVDESTVMTTYDPDSLEPVVGLWDRTISPPVAQVVLSPDGSRLMTVALTGGATIEDLDGATVRLDDVTAAWFAGGATTDAPATTEPAVTVDGPVVTIPAGDATLAGIVGGVLTYDGTCLSLVEPITGAGSAVVWRAGTTWDPDSFSVVLPDGRSIALGDRVEAGGGSADIAAMGDQLREAIGPCAIGTHVAVVSGLGVTVTPLVFPVTTGDAPALPSGALAVGPDDVVATRPDGTLWWYPGALGATPGEPVRLVEMGDPAVALEEGPGPNVIDAVAGVVDGTLVFGECCEPVAGAVSALTAPGAPRDSIGFGSFPVLHPTQHRLATVSPFGLTVTDLTTATATTAAFDTDMTVTRTQVAWIGNSGESLVVLGWDAAGWRLEGFRPDDISSRTLVRALGLPSPVSSTDPAIVTIAGIDAGWNLILAITDLWGTRLKAISPDDLVVTTPNPWNTSLPDGARAVHVSLDNRLIWIEGDALMTMTPGGGPRTVTTGVVEGWFASPSAPPVG